MSSENPSSSGRLFVFGLGFTGLRLAETLRAHGWSVAGTVRGTDRLDALRARGIDAHPFERGQPLANAAATLDGTTHLLISVPPDAAGDPVVDEHGPDIVRLGSLAWVGYLSTTGVYGDKAGGWVDETTEPHPTGPRQRQRLAAEQAWLDLQRAQGVPVHLFRLAGIYGPGRSAIDQVRAGTARRIDKPGQVFSRTHVDDIVQVLRASMARSNPGAVYNVCDDDPAPGHEVIAHACGLLGIAPPPLIPFDAATLSPMAASFYADSKRVSNDRIKRELGVTLLYPDYRSGLAAVLRHEGK